MPNLGDTFLGGGEAHGVDHLWMVINNPAAHQNRALIVNISTLRPNAEPTCILRAGEHPFVRHDSYPRLSSGPLGGSASTVIGQLLSIEH